MSSNDEKILAELQALRAEVAPLVRTARSMDNLRRDVAPRVEEAVRALILELGELEGDFQMEDLLALVKKSMRNVRTFSHALDQLGSLLNLVDNLDPLVRQSVPVWIATLEQLERKGVFTAVKGAIGVVEKLSSAYGQEDMERIGDGLVVLMGLARGISEPNTAALLVKLADAPGKARLDQVHDVGPWDLLKSLGDPAVRRGFGLVLELTRSLGEITVMPPGAGGARS